MIGCCIRSDFAGQCGLHIGHGRLWIVEIQFHLPGRRKKTLAERIAIEVEQGWRVVRGDDERHNLFHRESQQHEVRQAQAGEAASVEDALHVSHAKARDAEKFLAAGAVHIDGKPRAVAQGP